MSETFLSGAASAPRFLGVSPFVMNSKNRGADAALPRSLLFSRVRCVAAVIGLAVWSITARTEQTATAKDREFDDTPPAYGHAGVDKKTSTTEVPLSDGNDDVAVPRRGGHGTFVDPLLGISIVQMPDLVAAKLPALAEYQLSLEAPGLPSDEFDQEAVARGRAKFRGKATCDGCDFPPLNADADKGILHNATETRIDPAYAERTTNEKYRTTSLRTLWQHAPDSHPGGAKTPNEVVEPDDKFLDLGLRNREMRDLVEFLKSLS